jgi:hypothetical protein
MIKTAMLTYAYYNSSKATVILASPNVNNSVHESLLKVAKFLNEVFRLYGFQFTFKIYVNDFFNKNISIPLNHQTYSINTIQRDSVHESLTWKERKSTATQNYLRKITVSEDQVKIGILVRREIERFSKSNMLSDTMIQNLLDETYSKETFNLNYPILKKFVKGLPISEQRYISGYGRYWVKIYIINGGKYLLCNSWYERNRSKF